MRKVTLIKEIEEKIGPDIHNAITDIDEKKPKYMATFPYPYMNGKLHLGHAFTMCKVDYECRWKQINGYNVLFPFGFHCTGMPISASAKKLEKEFELGTTEVDGKNTQYSILLSSGIEKSIIKNFIDPKYWITYFPKFGLEDITKLGIMVDKRRSFITTDKNPFYDSFIKWQFNKLHKLGYLKFGTRNSIYSPNLQIQCQDHDRSVGESVQVETFSIYELVLENGKKLWIPFQNTFDNINQKIQEIKFNPKVSFNEYSEESGNQIIMTQYVYSHYEEQFKKLNLVKENINLDNLQGYENYGKIKKINNQYSNYLGAEISINKELTNEPESTDTKTGNILPIKLEMSEDIVIDRTGSICIVKAVPQWYIDYANSQWKDQALLCVSTMVLHSEIKTKLILAIKNLREWGVSRPFGLGTKLPMADDLLIDSLSDSTIYPAYYTIKHFIHSDLFGSDSKYSAEQFTEEIWDFVFLKKDLEKDVVDTEFKKQLDLMQKSFEYFYPVDMRISGKDLINNHLAMYIYNHVAIFDKKYYPVSINCNGWILVDGKKMSKSDGNFITIESALETNSIDAVRMTLADSGDSFDDANYIKANAGDHCTLKLFSWLETFEKMSFDGENTTSTYIDLMFEQVFIKLTNKIVESYSLQKYKTVIRDGFHEWNAMREKYKIYSKYFGYEINKSILKKITEIQILLLYPIMPHITSHIWKNILKKMEIKNSIYKNHIIDTQIDNVLIKKFELMEELIAMSRIKIDRAKKKNIAMTNVTIGTNTELIDDFMKKIIAQQLKQNIMYSHNESKNMVSIT
jgi:leucyl-tRNA synthetase